jgi:hypothetical protein
MTLEESFQLPEEEALEFEDGRVTQKASPKGSPQRPAVNGR